MYSNVRIRCQILNCTREKTDFYTFTWIKYFTPFNILTFFLITYVKSLSSLIEVFQYQLTELFCERFTKDR